MSFAAAVSLNTAWKLVLSEGSPALHVCAGPGMLLILRHHLKEEEEEEEKVQQ